MRKRTHNSDAPQPSGTRWDLVTGWIDPVVNDPLEDEDMRSDGDILGDVRGSARCRKLSSVTATSGSIPFEYMWEPDVDAFRPGVRHTFLIYALSIDLLFLSLPRSVRPLRYTLTG